MNPVDVVEDAPTDIVDQDFLTALDRCDLCGSQAYVSVLMESGDLLFCGHHYAKFEPKLTNAVKIHDERARLLG